MKICGQVCQQNSVCGDGCRNKQSVFYEVVPLVDENFTLVTDTQSSELKDTKIQTKESTLGVVFLVLWHERIQLMCRLLELTTELESSVTISKCVQKCALR